MTLSEFSCRVNEAGSLVISSAVLADMGLKPGDLVQIAYLSKDGKSNDFREFLLSDAGLDGIDEGETSFQIPNRLLEQANIPVDSDLQIACFDGMIVVCKTSSLELEELSEILERMKIARQLAEHYGFDDDLSHIKAQLEDTIDFLNEGGALQ